MRHPLFLFAACVMFAFGGCVVWMERWMNALPISQRTLDRVKVGMEKRDVLAILGRPQKGIDGNRWQYYSDGYWTMIYVPFDEKGRCKEIEIDN
jgi:outer membrane protein assembly factor BamE (lipoprotein component of BamABCDE complex)